MNSRNKGKRGELEWAKFLQSRGYKARRGQQYSGGPGSPDIVCEDLHFIHWEVKRTERLSLYKALQQAQEESGDSIPIVAHRKNSGNWVVILEAEDFFDLIEK